jgi:iron(III) transport system ATP-binding protein
MPSIEVKNLTKKFGETTAVNGISFSVPDGSFTTLLGPSGCGKTTTLRMLSGLQRPDSGEIQIGDRLVSSSEQGVFVPVEGRDVGIVFQSYALWPHMTVFDHVAYPLRVRRQASDVIKTRVMEALAMVHLEEQRGRYPSEISGGQQQRVALARALVFDPDVLFLDEPLSNLDAALRASMRSELARLHRETGVTTVYVTHDQTEALALSDQILVMRLGDIVEHGPPVDIYERPATLYGTQFVGAANCLAGVLAGIDGGAAKVELTAGDVLRVPANAISPESVGKPVTVVVRPEDVEVGQFGSNDDNVVTGVIRQNTYLGSHVEWRVAVGEDEIRVRAPKAATGSDLDDTVSIRFPYDHLRLHTETESTVADAGDLVSS